MGTSTSSVATGTRRPPAGMPAVQSTDPTCGIPKSSSPTCRRPKTIRWKWSPTTRWPTNPSWITAPRVAPFAELGFAGLPAWQLHSACFVGLRLFFCGRSSGAIEAGELVCQLSTSWAGPASSPVSSAPTVGISPLGFLEGSG